jgi:hypothetical protein
MSVTYWQRTRAFQRSRALRPGGGAEAFIMYQSRTLLQPLCFAEGHPHQKSHLWLLAQGEMCSEFWNQWAHLLAQVRSLLLWLFVCPSDLEIAVQLSEEVAFSYGDCTGLLPKTPGHVSHCLAWAAQQIGSTCVPGPLMSRFRWVCGVISLLLDAYLFHRWAATSSFLQFRLLIFPGGFSSSFLVKMLQLLLHYRWVLFRGEIRRRWQERWEGRERKRSEVIPEWSKLQENRTLAIVKQRSLCIFFGRFCSCVWNLVTEDHP